MLLAISSQLNIFKDLLNQYAAITGLKANYPMLSMIPINLDAHETAELAQFLDCQVASLPFTYLGLPMGTEKQFSWFM